jgi:hypothetical protein
MQWKIREVCWKSFDVVTPLGTCLLFHFPEKSPLSRPPNYTVFLTSVTRLLTAVAREVVLPSRRICSQRCETQC